MKELKKLFLKTYGCQMNVYDSERMTDIMGNQGYTMTDSPDDADMILLNTCHIREKAAEKIYSELGRYRDIKSKNSDLKIGVAGCVAQAEGVEIMARQPLVDFVVGPQTYHRLPEMLEKLNVGEKVVATEFPVESKFAHFPKRLDDRTNVTAFLTVQEGCDKFCTFCVVPYTRGAEVSRPVTRVVQEARELVGQGVREITLLGQNVNAYNGPGSDGQGWSLAKLIWTLSEIDGLDRIRFTTSHPNDMSDELIETHGECKKLMPYLHLPVQAGSDKILKRMNRQYTAESYIRLIEKIRSARPDILISGDFIVGFPEEDESDFQATLDLVEEVGYGFAYSFKYSARPGTPAAERMQVSEDVKSDRLQRLQSLLTTQQKAAQSMMVGRVVDVLFERAGSLAGQMVGKSDYLQAVHVANCDVPLGTIAPVEIIDTHSHSLAGVLASSSHQG
ncbi:MAG: tRNA (N6-isopentenyl adenosine(37)-C2)-methylthiotransferase MiaB [Aestuariivita sp.]|nr:tRNA (N6-isopentenyl adenosine(37)-C2)-methylthiotransferase MiaB [Aestuariivita sp.]